MQIPQLILAIAATAAALAVPDQDKSAALEPRQAQLINWYTGGAHVPHNTEAMISEVCNGDLRYPYHNLQQKHSCRNFPNSHKINFMIEYRGPGSNVHLNPSDCVNDMIYLSRGGDDFGGEGLFGNVWWYRLDPNLGHC